MNKSPEAFRTISEVAEWLETPTHVLRFWESRFSQVKPVKRAGGRRYYRPRDMELLGGIKKLLHSDGMTIRGVQKLLRKEGARHVATMSAPIDTADVIDVALADEHEVQGAPAAPEVAKPEIVKPIAAQPTPETTEGAVPEAPPKAPLLADVADDPADENGAVADITDVAASLRSIARAHPSQMPPSAFLEALYRRLVHLRDRMSDEPGAADT